MTVNGVPLVTVVMTVRNSAGTLPAAIDSVRNQTEASWELVVTDDGSTDDSPRVLASQAAADPRIRVITTGPLGRPHGRNVAISASRAPFIAIADADDRSAPTRLERQLELLHDRPEVAAVGTRLRYAGGEGHRTEYPIQSDEIRAWFDSGRMGLAHCSAMFRRSYFHTYGLYEPNCLRAQDYELLRRGYRESAFASIADQLVIYRLSPDVASLRPTLRRYRWYHYAHDVEQRRLAGRPPTPPDYWWGRHVLLSPRHWYPLARVISGVAAKSLGKRLSLAGSSQRPGQGLRDD